MAAVTNPDFEVNASGWSPNGSALSRDTTVVHGGGGALKVVTNGVGGVEGTFSA